MGNRINQNNTSFTRKPLNTSYFKLCQNIAIMDQGKKIAEGTKEELKQIIKNTETITIEVPMLPEIVLQSIKALEHVYQVTYEQEELKVYCSGGMHNLVDVLHILQEQQIAIGRVYTTLPTLNDVFLDITFFDMGFE